MGTISMYFDLGILIMGPLFSWTKNKTDSISSSNSNYYYNSSFELPVSLNSSSSYGSTNSSISVLLSRRGRTENDGLLICKYEWSVVQYAYSRTEYIWSTLIIVLIFGVNGLVLWVIRKSRTLWNPRHLFMVYLCGTNLLMGCHKIVELIIVQWPRWELCVIHRATFGIPILANLLLLTLISIDRFVAVKWPFFYISHTSGAIKYVLWGACGIVTVGTTLGLSFITVAFLEPLKDINLWAMYLPLVTALCTALILFFNTAVLRIARQQLCTMRALEASCHCNRPYSSCSVSSFPTLKSSESESESEVVMDPNPSTNCKIPITLPSPVRYLDHDYRDRNCNNYGDREDKKHYQYQEFSDVLLLSPSTLSAACSVSMNEVNRFSHTAATGTGTYGNSLSGSGGDRSFTGMPSLNSRIGIQSHRHCPRGTNVNVWWRPSRFFHVKLSRSIRLARTFLLMTVPIFLVILPIAIIIPLRRSCESDQDHSDHYGNKRPYLYHCSGPVTTLWEYLRIHVRSVLPIQAVTDALIYAFTCKEFVQCFHKVIRGRKQFHLQNSVH